MKQSESNPSSNKLPAGITEPGLVDAIESSGYPLQGVVAAKLLSEFSVAEEWGYLDRDSQENRTLDVFASKALVEDKSTSIQPLLTLLIECKRSEHPYVFFQNVTDHQISQFPHVAGLPGGVSVHESNSGRMQECAGNKVLGLHELPFVLPGPPLCCALSRAEGLGNKVRLSGSDPFNTLVLPLIKAWVYTTDLYRPAQRSSQLFPTLVLCVSVIDAPMVLVVSPLKTSEPLLIPWARVSRQEANRDRLSRSRYQFYSIDAVHIDFFDRYVSEKLLPFAREFAQRASRMEKVLFNGGTVTSLDNWTWQDIRPR